MGTGLTLGLFAAGLAVVLGASLALGAAVGPVGPAAPPPSHSAPQHSSPDGSDHSR